MMSRDEDVSQPTPCGTATSPPDERQPDCRKCLLRAENKRLADRLAALQEIIDIELRRLEREHIAVANDICKPVEYEAMAWARYDGARQLAKAIWGLWR